MLATRRETCNISWIPATCSVMLTLSRTPQSSAFNTAPVMDAVLNADRNSMAAFVVQITTLQDLVSSGACCPRATPQCRCSVDANVVGAALACLGSRPMSVSVA